MSKEIKTFINPKTYPERHRCFSPVTLFPSAGTRARRFPRTVTFPELSERKVRGMNGLNPKAIRR
jgi:hypothetical protein